MTMAKKARSVCLYFYMIIYAAARTNHRPSHSLQQDSGYGGTSSSPVQDGDSGVYRLWMCKLIVVFLFFIHPLININISTPIPSFRRQTQQVKVRG